MPKVLMVDDEADMELLVRQKFRKSLKEGTFEILFANSGVQALDFAKTDDIDVLITDVNMPEMDGLTLLEKMQELSPQTKAIVVSAYGDMGILRQAMNRGAYDFVTKPVDFEDLEQAICKTLDYKEKHVCPDPAQQLKSYQSAIIQSFPAEKEIQFEYDLSPHEKAWLFDVWTLDEDYIGVLLIHSTSSNLPEPLAIVLAHQLFKHRATDNPHTSLESYMDKETDHLTTILCYGVFHRKTHTWGFDHNGSFAVSHKKAGETHPIHPDQTSFLETGDGIVVDADDNHKIRMNLR